MKCPYCGCEDSKVVDSRPTDEGERIRRRRECFNCAKRFTTYEIVENTPLMIVKRDKSREPYNREKLTNGVLRACEKRPISLDQIDDYENLSEGFVAPDFSENLCNKDAISRALLCLTEIQKARVQRLFYANKTLKEIALEDGVSITSVFESISAALEKMRVFLS